MSIFKSVVGFLLLTVIVTFSTQNVDAAVYIVQDGKANAEIVIAEKPTRMQNLAAKELQKYVGKITGAELPIVSKPTDGYPVKIYIGESEFTGKLGLDNKDLRNGGFLMRSGKDWLALLGNDDDYFRETPADGGPLYAKKRNDRERATEAWKKKYGDKWASHLTSSFKSYHEGLGLWSIDEHGSLNAVNEFLRSLGVRWYMPGDFGEVCPEMTSISLPKIDKTVHPEFGTRFMLFHYNGAFQASEDEFMWQLRLGFYYDVKSSGGHGLGYVLSSDDNPEFYALYDGKRANKGNNRGRKPCLSSEGLMRCAVERARMLADDFGVETVSMMPTDGYVRLCECDKCKGKDTPERERTALLSDYVWDFVNRAAKEVARTHPDVKVINQAYNLCRLPPLKIKEFHPNVAVDLAQARWSYQDPEKREYDLAIRKGFLEKIPSRKVYMNNKYGRFASYGVPGFSPHRIAEDIKSLKGYVYGESMEVSRGHGSGRNPAPDPILAVNHLNCWVTARYWIDPDQDIDAVLDDYYEKFYGPAAGEMKTLIEFCETHWMTARSDKPTADRILALFTTAKAKVAADTIYGKRLALLDDFLDDLRDRSAQLEKEKQRKGAPKLRLWPTRGIPKNAFELDGKLDDEYWKMCSRSSKLRRIEGGKLKQLGTRTTFNVGTGPVGIYFGIRCEKDPDLPIVVTTKEHDDPAIWKGEVIDILLETTQHSYYHIAVNPAGAVCDLDREGGKENYRWDSEAQVATHVDKDYWSVEIVIPVVEESSDPFHQVVGRRKPPLSLPWYFNLCRRRVGADSSELSAFSPTGEQNCLVPEEFAILYDNPKK